ncbi:MAG: hypothetical protein PHR25_06730 [Clostridia bacterium]|nr:hypothetical protein [Clostridia bacterium]
MKIINISGKAMAGKDTTALILKDKLEAKNKKVLITHYADLLKYEAKTFFNWDGIKDEKGRQILQYMGTDVIREKNPDYWVSFIKEFIGMFNEEWDYVIIPDCRFKNECELWKIDGWDSIAVRVLRENFISNLTPEQLNHPSETALDDYKFDWYIHNHGEMGQLEEEIDEFVEWLEV